VFASPTAARSACELAVKMLFGLQSPLGRTKSNWRIQMAKKALKKGKKLSGAKTLGGGGFPKL
jgi:hypothetical protein